MEHTMQHIKLMLHIMSYFILNSESNHL